MTRQVIVLEVLDCALQSNDVPFLRDVLINGTFLSLVEVPDSKSKC